MSLINDALKKAQKQRTGEAESPASAAGGDSGPRAVRRGKSGTPAGLFVGIGVGAVALIAVVVGVVIFMGRTPAAPAKPAPVAQTPVVPAPVVQTPVAVVTPPVAPPPAIVVPAVTKPEPVVVAPPKVEPAKTPAVATVASTPVITVPAPDTPRVAGRLEPRAIIFIEGIRVAGIRASGSDRKVLMNDRVYRIGDLVEPEMGLTLTAIATNALTFQDERGGKYTRNF